ncbi:uncharacterized protein LOC113347984 isoform X1 [Papaver somniferum]|uniref:uncharacterized protein LOC113347984 isoform X1 n=1 Tax=Papaver somniferum TaxID=3469 RepID=UPI000E6F6F4D|nr:uncharacterized protein LOC113347984 isoform X1 [Papaver somniferum]XP_026447461.1 uncharacterized protein LOC113347984 isoform X1 [Papaver somniferum]
MRLGLDKILFLNSTLIMASTIFAALSALNPANDSLRTTLVTKISRGSDNVIPFGMKSNTKRSFMGCRVTAIAQTPEKINGKVYRGNFTIGSYEIGPKRKATIGTLLNHLQETAANHIRDVGLLGDGFNSTPEMTIRNLIWVVAKMQVVVDRYPSWGDVVEIDNWFGGAPIKDGFANHWLLRDAKTGETLAQAKSVWIMMNKGTRKLSKIPEEVRDEITPHITDYPIWDDIKLSKVHDDKADFVQTGVIQARWSDLDVNQHVNFGKYIQWILENSPTRILKSQELYDLALEFRRECGVGDELKSLTRVVETSGCTECQHMLQLENGKEVMRGRTKWRPSKHTDAVNLEVVVEFRSSADMFWETLKTWSSILPEVLPETYKSIEVIEDMNGEKNGSVTLWKMNPSTLVEGAPVMMEEMKKLEKLDELTKTITYSVIGGDLLNLYKSYEPQVTVTPRIDVCTKNGDGNIVDEQDDKDEKSGGIVKWSVKYEKVNEMVPEPYMIKDMIYKTMLKLDEYILSKGNEVITN